MIDLGKNTFTSDCNVEEKAKYCLNFENMLTIIKDSKNTYLFNRQLFKNSIQIDNIAIDKPERIVEEVLLLIWTSYCHGLYYNAD